MGTNMLRARKALDAMKSLGFSKKESTPVLKELLKLFGNNWEPIEDECYRALADAILDKRDNKSVTDEMRPVDGEPEPHSTTMVRMDDQQLSTSVSGYDMDNETETPLIKRPRMSSSASRREQAYQLRDHGSNTVDPESPRSTEEAQDTVAISHQVPGLASAQPTRRETRSSTRVHQTVAHGEPTSLEMVHENLQDTVFLREPKPEPDIDTTEGGDGASSCQDAPVAIVAHPLNIGSSGFGVPLALSPHNQNPSEARGGKDRSIQHCRTRGMSTSSVGAKQVYNQDNGLDHAVIIYHTETESAVENMQEAPCTDTVVASSTLGEVKMSLKCSVDPSKFRMPALEAVFKMVEDKCLRSYKICPPNFSIGNLMNEICQCVVQLGSDHTAEHNMQSDVLGNGSNLQNEAMVSNVPFVKPIACKNGGNGKHKAAEESSVLETSKDGPKNSIVARQPQLALSELRPIHDVTDITKGEERVRISVVNEFGSEKYPPSFNYIPRNLVFQNAYVNISVARIGDEDYCADCFGNCLSAAIPCACARETGGEYAYTPEGLVRTAFLDECVSMNRFPEKHHKFYCKACPLERSRNEVLLKPCRGHHIRKFIKECWSKCGCNMQCGNRVVQRGITCNLQVFFTREGKGWGLRTLDELPKGAFICEYVGEVLTNTELYERTVQNAGNAKYTYPVLLDADWGSEGVLRDEQALCLDATFYGNIGRFVNHRCYDANLVEIPIEVETPDHHYYHIAFFTTKKVEAFEELTWDYGIDFDDNTHPIKAFRCLCRSRYCRDMKHSRKRGKAAAKRA